MPDRKPSKVIIDTNLFISFLIGKELHFIKDLLLHEHIQLVISDILIQELILITQREKLRKYFTSEKVTELTSLLEIIAEKVEITSIPNVSPDPKDDFLFAMASESKADYLVTGDKALLAMKRYGKTQIVTASSLKVIFT